jgi:fermentation-respiration switch protein FrsA (DUF1100 family)
VFNDIFQTNRFSGTMESAIRTMARLNQEVGSSTAMWQGLNAQKLAGEGLITTLLTLPTKVKARVNRGQLENRNIRTEDISAVIDYLTMLPYVDSDKFGATGICTGEAYTANAAINDRRIKTVGTVSSVNIGSMFRNGRGPRGRKPCVRLSTYRFAVAPTDTPFRLHSVSQVLNRREAEAPIAS